MYLKADFDIVDSDTKKRALKYYIELILIYGSESWPLTEATAIALEAGEMGSNEEC